MPKLTEENAQFWLLFQQIMPGLLRPDRSFDYQAIAVALDMHGVPVESRPYLFDKCLSVMSVIQEMRTNRNG